MDSKNQRFSLSDSEGRWVLISTILASSMAFIQSSALNVALNALQQDLQATGIDLIWIVNGYMLFLASFILLGGSLGDHFGRRKVFGIGIAIFAGASLASGFSPNTGMLIITRMIQGLGGALMVPGSLAIITALIRDEERGRAIGIWSSASTVTTLGGPVLGGYFADNFSWRFVFFIVIPLALIALYGVTRFPENRDEHASPHLDYLGAFLVTLGLAGLTYGLVTLGDRSSMGTFATSTAVLALVVGIAALIAFVFVERRSKNPMVNLNLFRSRMFAGTNAMTGFLYAALAGALLFLPLNLTQVQGYSASLAGLASIPTLLLITVLSPFMGGLSDRIGARIPLTVGPVIVGIGFILYALPGITGGPDTYWTTFFPGAVGVGLGMGIVVAPLVNSVMGAVPRENSGIASGINNAITRSSQVLATAVMGAVILLVFQSTLMQRTAEIDMPQEARAALEANAAELGNTTAPASLSESARENVSTQIDLAFVDAFRVVVIIGGVLCFISALLSVTILPSNRTEQEEKRKSNVSTESAT